MNESKEWIIFYLHDWQEIMAITADAATLSEIAETRKLLAYENDVSINDITVKIEKKKKRKKERLTDEQILIPYRSYAMRHRSGNYIRHKRRYSQSDILDCGSSFKRCGDILGGCTNDGRI